MSFCLVLGMNPVIKNCFIMFESSLQCTSAVSTHYWTFCPFRFLVELGSGCRIIWSNHWLKRALGSVLYINVSSWYVDETFACNVWWRALTDQEAVWTHLMFTFHLQTSTALLLEQVKRGSLLGCRDFNVLASLCPDQKQSLW